MRAGEKVGGEVELDVGRYELRRGGRRLRLEKKPMELLILLVERREQLVSRDEIIAKLWGSDLFIDTEASINNVVRKIRAALGDNPDKPRFLETVVGKGYRFVGPVRMVGARFGPDDATTGRDWPQGYSRVPGTKARDSLAVLLPAVAGSAPDERGLSLGITDALIARLGNLERMTVLPTSAVLNLPSDMTAAEVGARLGARFVVRGAIRMAKEQWRLSLELLDTQARQRCYAKECDLPLDRLHEVEDRLAREIAIALKRPFTAPRSGPRPRYSRDAMAYSEFMRGYRLGHSGDPKDLEEAAQRLTNAVSRDPEFSLAHATLSVVCATRHFEMDPASRWLEKAEFHCARALELDAELPEGHVAKAYLLWGPSKNFQHLEAIAELKRALKLQSNLPHAYNRLGTILAHVGLLDRAREMYERGAQFHPRKAVSHSIVQVLMWSEQYEAAREEIAAWRAENPGNKYAAHFAPQPAMMTGEWVEAKARLDEAAEMMQDEPLIISLRGVFHALRGEQGEALECLGRSCASPKTFGHAHHTYYQIACILSLLGRLKPAFEWLERSVSTGFACWPFFLKDPCLENLRALTEFEVLVTALQAKYPDHLGLL